MRVKNIGFWWILFSIITLIFSPAIIYPFFQDDFFALVTTRVTSLTDVLSLFRLIPEAVYWRPLGIQLYFALMQFLGLKTAIWFHLVSLAVHLVNTYLVYLLVLRDCHSRRYVGIAMTKRNEGIAKLAAFLWGTSPIHYFALGWAVNFSFILVATWSILAILAAKEGEIFRAILFLILGLMTNEIAVVIPGLVITSFALGYLVGGNLLVRRHPLPRLRRGRGKPLATLGVASDGSPVRRGGSSLTRKFANFDSFSSAKLLILMLTTVAVYLIWRLASGIKIQGDYELGLTTALSTLRWYGLWILGWSDIVRDFIRWGVVFSSEFVKTFPAIVVVYFIELAVILGIATSSRRNVGTPRNDGLLWVIIGLLPVLFFQKHLYSHYAAIAAIGFYWWLAEIAVKRGREMLIATVWIMVVLATMGLNYRVSWMADHAANSGKFQSMVREQMPSELVSRIYIVSDGLKVQTVLLGGYGVEYLTGVSSDKVTFVNSEDEIPQLNNGEGVIYL